MHDPSLSPPYTRYARVYDYSGQVRFALLMHLYLQDLFLRHPVNGRRAIDLACGTGTLALLLAADGWEVTGLDCSAAMLTEANAKNQAMSGKVRFVLGDMRRLDGLAPKEAFDLATCTYDSLNYMLSEDDLAACFGAVADILSPSGLYVADMNTRYFLEHEWGVCAIRELGGYVQIEQSHFDPVTAQNTTRLTGFIGSDEHGYERFDEIHTERAYPAETVTDLMERAGLRVEALYDGFTFDPPGPRTQRIVWVARKR